MRLLLLSVLMLNICGAVADDDEGFSMWGSPLSQKGGGDSGEVAGGFGYQGNMYYGTGQTGQSGNYQGYPVNYGNPLIQGYPANYGNVGNQGYPMYPGSSGGRSSQEMGGVQGNWYPGVHPTNTFVSGGVSPNLYQYTNQRTGSFMSGGDSSVEQPAVVYPLPTRSSSEEHHVSPVGDYYDYSDEHVPSTASTGGDSYDSGENVHSTATTGSDSDDSEEQVPVSVTTGGDSGDSGEHVPSPTIGVMGGDSGDSGENQVRVIYPGETVVVGDGDNSAETVLGGGINLTPSDCQELLEIVAVVDGSDSISTIDFQTLKHTLLSMVDQLNINDNNQRFGVVLYSTNISAVINLSGDRAYLRRQISQLDHPRDGTNTADGISAMNIMLQRYARPGVPKVAVVITDGMSKNPGATAQAARVSKLLGVNMFAVGVGLSTDIMELQSIASGSDHVLTVAQFQQLDGLMSQLFKRVCPVQGGWTHWADSYGACSVFCGGGLQVITRTRTCTNPSPANGGLYCVGDALVTLTVECNTHGCPVDGGWSLWTDTVAQCSVTCGGGSQLVTRTRTCTNPAPAYNGQYCVGDDRTTFTQACNTQGCPVDGGWSLWTDTVALCSVSCGGGSQLVTRTRTCTNPAPAYNGQYCVGDDRTTFTQACNTQGCPVDGGWSLWTDTVALCSVSCGGGSQLVTRTRTCTNPAPAYNGQYCVGDDRATFTQACNTQGCPVDGGWSLWTDTVAQCSVSCGGGSQLVTRTRTCTNPAPAYYGQYCVGDDRTTFTQACNTQGCPVDGGWSMWTDTVAQCSVSCGGGTQIVTRSRTCTNPAPAYNGQYCVGDDRTTFTQACNTQGCPVDGGWSLWTDTESECSVSCGGGTLVVTSTRTCTNPAPAFNGQYCVGDDRTTSTKACNTHGCPVDGGWSLWTDTVAQCSVTCGGGSQLVTRTRTCTNPAPAYNGQYCVGDDRTTFTQACNTQGCPVDGGWSLWTDTVAQCSVSCGGGTQLVTRTRTCTNPAPAYNGQYCVGDDRTTFTQACNTQGCPVDGGWSEWTDDVAQCSVSCGGGSQLVTRTRTCTNPAPAYNGQYCVGDARTTFTQSCNTQGCPVDGAWTEWTEAAGACSLTCGGGSQTVVRMRSCTNPAPSSGGSDCVGEPREIVTRACNTQQCPVTTTEKPDLGLCNDCKMDNGIGYNPHPSDCNKYIQCMFDNNQLIKVEEMECPHGLYWDQDKLTCNRPEEVNCPAERCNDPMTTTYPSATTCSGYWQCVGGVSKGRCCPAGQAYSIAGYCVPSTTCTTPCKGDGGQGACDKRPISGDRTRFQQFVKGHGWITMTCAPGSSYNSTECRCSIQGGVVAPDTCKPDVYLSFIDDVGDKSDSGVYIQNDGVKVKNGVGYFDGKSGLRIPRFANAELGSTVYIRIRYRGEGSATRKQALLSNGDCGKDASISVARGPASTYFGVRSGAGKSASVSVSSSTNGWNEAFFKLDAGMLSGSVGSSAKQTAFLGNIQRANCALQIGRGTNFANFRGYIDNVTIYLCRP
ncbi:SCO-spondin-like isoform X5 [Haliotis rubra]|uniref:SCO-spondin-like isoform X5 n=1 Tax=Haliotis rubra TaxID=36100 RepID=UPI001EE5CB55|nr:SCO-spondin-like isoform X5 [Haliotis rubra]